MTGVRVDMNPCQSNSRYGSVAPEISELGEDTPRWRGEVDPSLRQKVLEAVEACPKQAIRAED
jgi:ferredoxin